MCSIGNAKQSWFLLLFAVGTKIAAMWHSHTTTMRRAKELVKNMLEATKLPETTVSFGKIFKDVNPEVMHSEMLNKFFESKLSGTWVYPEK